MAFRIMNVSLWTIWWLKVSNKNHPIIFRKPLTKCLGVFENRNKSEQVKVLPVKPWNYVLFYLDKISTFCYMTGKKLDFKLMLQDHPLIGCQDKRLNLIGGIMTVRHYDFSHQKFWFRMENFWVYRVYLSHQMLQEKVRIQQCLQIKNLDCQEYFLNCWSYQFRNQQSYTLF